MPNHKNKPKQKNTHSSSHKSDRKLPPSRVDERSNTADNASEPADNQPFALEGRNAVMEALNAEKTLHRLYVTNREVEGSLRVIIARAKERGIPVMPISKDKLDEMSENGRHQGVIALCPAYEYTDLDAVLHDLEASGQPPFLVILDKIYDPHNLGAIIRTACAVGAHAVIIPKRRSAGITAAVVRASAGAVEHLPVCRVANIAQTLDRLKKRNIWAIGVEQGGDPIHSANLTGAIALVIGNEDEGISRLVSEKCDMIVTIPMVGAIGSLNASVAAAVAMYEVRRQQ